jgi:hypothetical protein
MPRFIFMLTHGDETIPNAGQIYSLLSQSGLEHVGCKDVGLPKEELADLFASISGNGHSTYLEVVSEAAEDSLKAVRTAAELQPNYLIGGTEVSRIKEILRGTRVLFFPYIGHIVGHPCLLRGSVEDITEDARRAEAAGADGINLLAYRYDGNPVKLMESVMTATDLPLICAGSVDSLERVQTLAQVGIWGFTIGTAVLDRQIVLGASLAEQIDAVLSVSGVAS